MRILNWLSVNYIEISGTITGLVYLYFSIRQNILLWLFGILNAGLYIYVFFSSRLYADMSLQVYYLVVSLYGWYHWVFGSKNNDTHELPVSRLIWKQAVILFFIFIILFISLYFILKKYTDSPVPTGDSFATALSIVATWMLARKILEHWLVWIVVDAFCMGLFYYKDLYPTVFLYFVFTVMAFTGYFQWKKTISSYE
ncbi:MAG: nicotinamide riboside transporter PnuC [Bacteroidia bacterium]|nr:nicotinamide riboside transporter PnuC [Bacteroidia bacterium]